MKKIVIIILAALCLAFLWIIASGFSIQTNTYITDDFVVSEDGSMITFKVDVGSSMGYVRGYKDDGGGVKPHYLKFYSAWGGLNSSIGAKNEFVLELEPEDTEIYLYHGDGGYELALKKDVTSGGWQRCADENVAQKCDAHLAVNNAEALLNSQDVIRRDMLRVKDGENTLALPLMKELLVYGSSHSDFVVLEGIMYADWYKSLFELAIQLYDTKVYAYYFDIPFEETLKRHQTKPNCNDFGEEAMRRWWREKDFSDVLNEVSITSERDIESIVSDICNTVINN